MGKERTIGLRSDPKLLKSVVDGIDQDLFRDHVGRALLRAVKLGVADDQIAGMIQARVDRHTMRRAMGQVTPLRDPQLHRGELELGTTRAGDPIRVPVQALAAGFLLVANTGSGKSNFLSQLIPRIAATGVRTWITDNYKQQLRLMRPQFRAFGEELVILRARDTRLNFLQASPNEPGPHLSLACDLLSRLLDLPSRGRTMIRQTTFELYSRFGIWRGQSDEWPTLFDLYEAIRTGKGLNPMAKEAVLDRLAALLLALTPECAAYRRGWTHADLAQHNVVFEMAGASEVVKHAILIPTVFGQFLHRIASGVVNSRMTLFTMLDDAQRFLNDSQQLGQGDSPPFVEAAGVVRGAGIGLGVAVQSTRGLPQGLTENLAVQCAGRLGSAHDWRRMGAELSLNAEQLEWAVQNLQPGSFIAQMATGKWRRPFILHTALLKARQPVSDTDVLESQAALKQLPVRFAEEFRHWNPYGPVADVETPSETSSLPPTLEPLQRRLLAAIIQDPGQPSRVYAKRLKTNGARIRVARLGLEGLGYIRAHQLATGKRGRQAIAFEPLEPGVEALAEEA